MFNARSTAEQVTEGLDLRGKCAIVTGASAGIGQETARVLALRGCHVTMACRDLRKGGSVRDRLIADSAGRIGADALTLMPLDLANLQSVRELAAEYLDGGRPIHLLINNAGIMIPMRRETDDGFEAHFGVNHLGHFLLTVLLLDRIRQSAPARIINVASDALHFATLTPEFEDLNWEKRKFSGWRSYGDSKLMNHLFANELSRRLEGTGAVAHALHPGIILTELARDQPWFMKLLGLLALPIAKNVARGAATTLYAATAPELAAKGGGYFSNCAATRPGKLAGDAHVEARLWAISEELTGISTGSSRTSTEKPRR